MNDMAIWVKPHTVHHERCKTSGAPKFRPLKKKKKKFSATSGEKKKNGVSFWHAPVLTESRDLRVPQS